MATPKQSAEKIGRALRSMAKNVLTPMQNKIRAFIIGNDPIEPEHSDNISNNENTSKDFGNVSEQMPYKNISELSSIVVAKDQIEVVDRSHIENSPTGLEDNVSSSTPIRHTMKQNKETKKLGKNEKDDIQSKKGVTKQGLAKQGRKARPNTASKIVSKSSSKLRRNKAKTKTSKLSVQNRLSPGSNNSKAEGTMNDVCYRECKYERKELKSVAMIQCCSCMEWYHETCIDRDKKFVGTVWNCIKCRQSSDILINASNDIQYIKGELKRQSEILIAFNEALTTIVENNFCLAEQLKQKSDEILALKKENQQLVKEVNENCISQSASEFTRKIVGNVAPPKVQPDKLAISNTPSMNPQINPPPAPTRQYDTAENNNQPTPGAQYNGQVNQVAFLGSSSMKKISETFICPSENTQIKKDTNINTVEELSEAVRNIKSETLLIHCGSKNATKERACTTIHRIKRLEKIITSNKYIKNVIISGLLQRSDSYDYCRRCELINEGYKLMCETNNWIYIDNSNVDLSCLDNDGVHPNEAGILRLCENMRQKLSCTVNQQNFTMRSQKCKK